MTIVVDASVALRWCFQLNGSDRAEELLRSDDHLIAPDLVIAEITNAAWKFVIFDIFQGDMSIVGPRPHATAQSKFYQERITPFSRRHIVKPGITGWAQVNGLRGETDTLEKMQERVEHDLYYIDNWSFLLDMKIILLTLLSKRAYINAY